MSKGEGLGLVHVITGPGKGKTTAAFGLALRASGHGLRVCVVQFMKTGQMTGEVIAARHLKGVELRQFGTGRFVDPKNPSQEDRRSAKEGLDFVRKRLSKGGCDLLILDEVSTAVAFGLLESGELLEMLKSRGEGVEVVLTGRNAPLELIEAADYVSIIESKKHPFGAGTGARKGIEW